MKKYEDLTLRDDFVFGKVMQDESICKHFLEKLLNISINRIEYVELQKSLTFFYDGKGVRLDVYVNDDAGSVYDIEIQTAASPYLLKRSRMYHAMMDSETLEKGAGYDKLPNSFVIFVCTFDIGKDGLCKHTIRNICEENSLFPADDGRRTIFLSPYGNEEMDPDLKGFLDALQNIWTTNSFSKNIQKRLDVVLNSKEWRRDYMFMSEKFREAQETARKQGLIEGHAEGLAEGRAEGHAEGHAEGRAEGRAEGLQESLSVVIPILRKQYTDFASLCKAVHEMSIYKDIPEEQIREIFENCEKE